MKFIDSHGKVCDSDDIERATVTPISDVTYVLAELETYAMRDRATKIQPYTFQRWLDVLKRES